MGVIKVPRNPEWVKWIAPEKFNDPDFFRIVTFFVLHSPCPEVSAMGRTLSEYGWTNRKKQYYLDRQLTEAATNESLLYCAETYKDMGDELEKASLGDDFPSNIETERICVYKYNRESQFLSVFHHLRNALAHCRLSMADIAGDCVLILEDVVPKKKVDFLKVSARMILRKSTLLKWIDIIEAGEKEYSQKVK